MTTEVLRICSTDPLAILIEVARAIFTEPRRYNQNIWGTRNMNEVEHAPPCGTVCCIAGWVAVGRRGKKTPEEVLEGAFTNYVPNRARRLLRLTPEQSGRLFDWDAARAILRADAKRNKTLYTGSNVGSENYAHAGIRHIDRFIRKEMGYRGPKLLKMFEREKVAAAKAAVAAIR